MEIEWLVSVGFVTCHRYSDTDFSRTVSTTAIKLTGMTVPPVSNQRQTNSDCTIRQTRSLFLPTQAYNSSHVYMVRLVWFPGYVDWERRTVLGKYEGKRGRPRSEDVAQCVSLEGLVTCLFLNWVHIFRKPRKPSSLHRCRKSLVLSFAVPTSPPCLSKFVL